VDVALATSDSIIVEIAEKRPEFVESFGRENPSTFLHAQYPFYPGTNTSELRRYQHQAPEDFEQQ
jgi:hypothetical protein